MNSREKIKNLILEDFDEEKNLKIIKNKIYKAEKQKQRIKYGIVSCILLVLTFFSAHQLINKKSINLIIKDDIQINIIESGNFDLDSRIEIVAENEFPSEFNIISKINYEYKEVKFYKRFGSSIPTNSNYNELVGYDIFLINGEQFVDIFMSKTKNSKYSAYSLNKENFKKSRINNNEIIIYKNEGYNSVFTLDNIYFDIVSSNISETQMLKIINAITKK